MDWLAKYWWILVIVFLVGVLLNVIKYLKRDDDDDWPKKDQPKK